MQVQIDPENEAIGPGDEEYDVSCFVGRDLVLNIEGRQEDHGHLYLGLAQDARGPDAFVTLRIDSNADILAILSYIRDAYQDVDLNTLQ